MAKRVCCLWFCFKSQNLLTALSEGSLHFWILRQSILQRWHPIHIIPQKSLLGQVYRSDIWPGSLICKAAVSSRHLSSQESSPWPVCAELMLPWPLACVSRQVFPPSCPSPTWVIDQGSFRWPLPLVWEALCGLLSHAAPSPGSRYTARRLQPGNNVIRWPGAGDQENGREWGTVIFIV